MQKHPVVLIVEDDPLDLEMILIAFRAATVEAKLRPVRDGAEAIAYLGGVGVYADRARYPYPHLLITDLKMPMADGFAVLEFLRSRPSLAIVPTVMLSGSSDQSDIDTAYRLGASSYIAKPLSPVQLGDRMQTLIEYWSFCEAPLVWPSGEHRETENGGKLGERYR